MIHSHRFDSAEQLAAYLGLVPIERQSGSSIRGRARLSKAGPPKIRAVLYMAAIVATKYNPHVKVLYDRLVAKAKLKWLQLARDAQTCSSLLWSPKNRMPYRRIMQKSVDPKDGI